MKVLDGNSVLVTGDRSRALIERLLALVQTLLALIQLLLTLVEPVAAVVEFSDLLSPGRLGDGLSDGFGDDLPDGPDLWFRLSANTDDDGEDEQEKAPNTTSGIA